MPPQPTYRLLQRHNGRFFKTLEMMELLSVYYGARREKYPHTWWYRTLIAAHREEYNQIAVRVGYGKDWKREVKNSIIRGEAEGKLTVVAKKRAAEHIRRAELDEWQIVAFVLTHREEIFKLQGEFFDELRRREAQGEDL